PRPIPPATQRFHTTRVKSGPSVLRMLIPVGPPGAGIAGAEWKVRAGPKSGIDLHQLQDKFPDDCWWPIATPDAFRMRHWKDRHMIEPRNRVVQLRRFGGPEELQVVDAPLPTAGRGEVRVRVLASGLEYTDVTIRRHVYPQTAARRPPFVLGYDVVGEIDQLGEHVTGLRLGDRVADMTVLGSNAAYRTLRAREVIRVPAGLDPAEAATLILSWTTAYQLLHRAARVRPGQRVLVHGAAGAVGQALLALGRLAGLELWGSARGEHAALVRELGAPPLPYQPQDFPPTPPT